MTAIIEHPQALIAGRWTSDTGGGELVSINPADGSVHRANPGLRRRRCRPGRLRRRRGPSLRRLVRAVAAGTGRGAAAAGRPDGSGRRTAGVAGQPGGRQADHRMPGQRRPRRDRVDPLVRRGGGQDLHRRQSNRAGAGRVHRAGAGRRCRRDPAVELPAGHGRLEGRSGAGGGQLSAAQTGRRHRRCPRCTWPGLPTRPGCRPGC